LRRQEVADRSNEFGTLREFAARIREMKGRDVSYLERVRQQGRTAFGLGAPAKGNTLLNYFGIGPDLLGCLVERNELRRGLVSPGMHIPIVLENELPREPDVYYVLAWNFKAEILRRYQPLIQRGVEFYFPVNPKDA
jgi:hypothetical protein